MGILQKSSQTLKTMASQALAKLCMSIAAFMVALNLFVILTLFQMAPKLQVISQIARKDPMNTQELILERPFSENKDDSDRKLIREMLLRYYLDMRLTSFRDEEEMMRRWSVGGPVWALSSPKVYKDFTKGGLVNKIKNLAQNQSSQSIDIISIKNTDTTYTIDYDIYSYSHGKINVKKRSDIVKIGEDPARKYFRRIHSNPYGFFVEDYTAGARN